MKYDTLKAFQKHLLSASPLHFSSVYLLMAQDPFLVKEALTHLTSLLGKEAAISHPLEGKIGEELASLTLFGKRKLVIVEEAETIGKKEQEFLSLWVKKPAKECYLIMVGKALKKTTLLYKAVEKYGVICEIPEIKPWHKEKEAVAWVMEKAAFLKKPIDERAASLLVEWIGSDKTALFLELEKLALFAVEKPIISIQEVTSLCRAVPKENAFKLAEALLLRDGKRAVSIWVSLEQEGMQSLQLLRLLRQQFETDLRVALLCGQGKEEEIPTHFPYMKGFIMEQHKKQAATYGIASLKKGLLAIDETESRIKSISLEPEILLSTLIAKLCVT